MTTSETESMTATAKALEALHDEVGRVPLRGLVAPDNVQRVSDAWFKAGGDRGSASTEALVEFFDTLVDAAPADVSGWPDAVLNAAAEAERALHPLMTATVDDDAIDAACAGIDADWRRPLTGVMGAVTRAHLAKKHAAASAEHYGAISAVGAGRIDAPTLPPSNATCRCGAPSLALFSSHECSRGAECPIVAGEPGPEKVIYPVTLPPHGIELGYEASGNGHEHRHPTREGAVALWHRGEAAGRRWDSIEPLPPKVAIGVDLATGPDRSEIVGYALGASVPDTSRPGHEMVTIQWRAPVVTAQARADVGATIDKALADASVGQWMPRGMYRASNGHDAPCALCAMLSLDPDAAQAGHVCTCGRHPERAVRS